MCGAVIGVDNVADFRQDLSKRCKKANSGKIRSGLLLLKCTSVDSMRDNGQKHFVTNGIVNGTNFGTTFSSLISHAKDSLDESYGVNKFQVLREPIENYLCSHCDLSIPFLELRLEDDQLFSQNKA